MSQSNGNRGSFGGTNEANRILDNLRNAPGDEALWNRFFAVLAGFQNKQLEEDPSLSMLEYPYWALPETQDDFETAGKAARNSQLQHLEVYLYQVGVYHWPALLDQDFSPTILRARELSREIAQQASKRAMATCIRALIQTYFSFFEPIDWLYHIKSISLRDYDPMFLHHLIDCQGDPIASSHKHLQELIKDCDQWVHLKSAIPAPDVQLEEYHKRYVMLWPKNPEVHLAIMLAARGPRKQDLRELLQSLCVSRRCWRCWKTAPQIPVIESWDLHALSCMNCGRLSKRGWYSEGFIIPGGLSEYFRAANLVNVFTLRCGGFVFSITRPKCLDPESMCKNFVEQFRDLAVNEIGFCRMNDLLDNTRIANTKHYENSYEISIQFLGKLEGREKEFEDRYIKHFQSIEY